MKPPYLRYSVKSRHCLANRTIPNRNGQQRETDIGGLPEKFELPKLSATPANQGDAMEITEQSAISKEGTFLVNTSAEGAALSEPSDPTLLEETKKIVAQSDEEDNLAKQEKQQDEWIEYVVTVIYVAYNSTVQESFARPSEEEPLTTEASQMHRIVPYAYHSNYLHSEVDFELDDHIQDVRKPYTVQVAQAVTKDEFALTAER